MNDRALSGLILILAAGFGAYLFYRRLQAGATAGSSTSSSPAGGPATTAAPASGTPLQRLLAFASGEGLTVTSTTGGHHNPGSLHYQGRAIDVSARGLSAGDIARVIRDAAQQGFRVLDERMRLPGEKVWGGPHLHIEQPYQRFAQVAP